MAIHNQIFLYGMATDPAKIIKSESGEYIQGSINLTVAPGKRQIDDVKKGQKGLFRVEFSKLPILSGDPHIIEEMANTKPGDIVLIKGNLLTRNVVKKKICPKCGTPYKKEGVLTFISPIHYSIEKTDLTLEDSEMELRNYCEVSNIATVIGTICRDPEIKSANKRSMIVSFPLAIDRKFFVASDNPENRTDYPYIQIFGKEKGNDVLRRCHTGTTIFVDGIVKTRKYKKMQFPCENPDCDQQIDWNDWTIDIIPFALEYLSDWKTDEELAKEEAEKAKSIHESIFSGESVPSNEIQGSVSKEDESRDA